MSKFSDWLLCMFKPTVAIKQESVEVLITDSLNSDTSYLQLAVSSDKETIQKLSLLLKNTCYSQLVSKTKEIHSVPSREPISLFATSK